MADLSHGLPYLFSAESSVIMSVAVVLSSKAMVIHGWENMMGECVFAGEVKVTVDDPHVGLGIY